MCERKKKWGAEFALSGEDIKTSSLVQATPEWDYVLCASRFPGLTLPHVRYPYCKPLHLFALGSVTKVR